MFLLSLLSSGSSRVFSAELFISQSVLGQYKGRILVPLLGVSPYLMQIFTFILVQFNTIPFSPLVHAVDGTLKGRFVLMFINDILAWCHPQTL